MENEGNSTQSTRFSTMLHRESIQTLHKFRTCPTNSKQQFLISTMLTTQTDHAASPPVPTPEGSMVPSDATVFPVQNTIALGTSLLGGVKMYVQICAKQLRKPVLFGKDTMLFGAMRGFAFELSDRQPFRRQQWPHAAVENGRSLLCSDCALNSCCSKFDEDRPVVWKRRSFQPMPGS